MSTKAEKILALAVNFEKNATESLVSEAKKSEKKKLDPKAKVRNRGSVCVPAESAKDKKDHFPINSEDQARNALARVHQYSSVPEWYKGSLSGLQALVARKVKAKYPKIDVGGKKKEKKSYLESFDGLINKFAQNYATMSKDQLAGYPKATLDYLMQWSMISPQQYSEALSTKQVFERAKPPPGTPGSPEYAAQNSGETIELDDVKPTPAKPAGLAYNKNVEIAQQQLANMGGYDLGTTGRYGNGVDGQLGGKTLAALKKFNPSATPQQAIQQLVQKYNAGPEPVKPDLPPPNPPQDVAQQGGPVKTWGA